MEILGSEGVEGSGHCWKTSGHRPPPAHPCPLPSTEPVTPQQPRMEESHWKLISWHRMKPLAFSHEGHQIKGFHLLLVPAGHLPTGPIFQNILPAVVPQLSSLLRGRPWLMKVCLLLSQGSAFIVHDLVLPIGDT